MIGTEALLKLGRGMESTLAEVARDDWSLHPLPANPSLYQINTRVWLTRISASLGRRATLDDIPDRELDRLAESGFDWIWFLSVWQTGEAAQKVSRSNPEWRKEFQQTLPDLTDEDIPGSGFSIAGYTVHRSLGGNAALARLRQRLRQRGLRLLLDFVPNHMARDHPWVKQHPDYFVHGTERDLANAPQNFCRLETTEGSVVLAYGRDPYFPGWSDTLQLNYGNPAAQQAMIGELLKIAKQCDGVRCDMAMLLLPDVFERTWGIRPEPFWSKAVRQVRDRFPEFTFMAEAYWDLEWTLMQDGFDYAYDKRLYDRLREGHATPVREHLSASLDYQNRLVRFLENHDEPRAAATFPPDVHRAAATITFLSPGLRLFHQGQLEGHKKRISPHLGRGPDEAVDANVRDFYDRLLAALSDPVVRDGRWQLLECQPAWDGNASSNAVIAFAWEHPDGGRRLAIVNYAPHQSQCYVRLPFTDLAGSGWRLSDRLGDVRYDRDGSDLASRGFYLDEPAWRCYVFDLIKT